MTQEDKELLLKDLCARLLYGVYGLAYIVGEPCNTNTNIVGIINESIVTNYESPMLELIDLDSKDITIKPYLRPMSSMTENEYKELKKISDYYGLAPFEFINDWEPNYHITDWLNRKMLDYRGLIEKDLALKALEGMYNKH